MAYHSLFASNYCHRALVQVEQYTRDTYNYVSLPPPAQVND